LPAHTHALLRFADGAALAYEDRGVHARLGAACDERRAALGATGAGIDPLAERIDAAAACGVLGLPGDLRFFRQA
jgi:hypothetical protein